MFSQKQKIAALLLGIQVLQRETVPSSDRVPGDVNPGNTNIGNKRYGQQLNQYGIAKSTAPGIPETRLFEWYSLDFLPRSSTTGYRSRNLPCW